FREGSRHAQRGAWDEARERFERSLALRRAALTLYSLGVAQKNLGLLVEATESFNAFLAEASVPATRPYEAPARAAIAELDKKLAHVTLHVSPADAEGLRVRVDSEDVPRESLGVPRPLNPGEHFLAVSARGYRPESQSFTLAEGGARAITLALEPFALPPRDEAAPAPKPPPCPPAPAPAPAPRIAPAFAPERPARVGPWLLAAAGALAAAGGLWLSLDAVASDDPNDAFDDRSSRRREVFGHALTTGGLVSVGVGVGLWLALPAGSAAAPRAPGAPRAALGLSF
ncbi:MAG TPA: hypothetical protein VFS00_17775, partial [Polyangiaceae bacterium]|nr:hypothetical protein [Polyangiaceae bacterium]